MVENDARPRPSVNVTADEFEYLDLLESESSDSDEEEEVYSKIQNRKKDYSKYLCRPNSRPVAPASVGGAGDAADDESVAEEGLDTGLVATADRPRLLLRDARCRSTSLVDETSTPITIRKEGCISKQLSISSSSKIRDAISDRLPLKKGSGKLFSRPRPGPAGPTTTGTATSTRLRPTTTFSRPSGGSSSRPNCSSATTRPSSSRTRPRPTSTTTINSIPMPTDFGLKSPVRRYENKTESAFITGFNVMSKEAYTKRNNRAKRFGIEPISAKEVPFIIPKEGSKINGNSVRPEALFVRGVDNMSTQDVFRYFGSYGPSSIEWLNDTSCNVVWLDPNTTARALMGMSHPHYINKGPMIEEITPRIDVKSLDNTSAAEPMEQDDDDYLDLVNDSETGERVRIPRRPCQELVDRCNTQNRATTEDADMEVEKAEEEKPFEITEEEGLRDALPFAKSEHLQIRYATKADKKQVGAQNRSWYYIRHGNPNYNGMKGIISNSMKKRISEGKSAPTTRASRKRRMETCVDEDKIMKRERTSPHGDGDAENLEQEVKLLTRAPSPKRVMRMYADDVEQQVKNMRKLSAPVGLQVLIEPDHHHTINRIGGEMNNSGIIRRIGRHPLRGAVEGAKRSEHHNLFPDLRGKLNNRKTGRRLFSENSNVSVEIGDELQ